MDNSNVISKDYSTDLSFSLANDYSGPDQYRFSGYQLPKVSLDETGPSYYVVAPHPYFYNQPEEWTKPAYQYGHPIGDNPYIIASEASNGPSVTPDDFKPVPFANQINNTVTENQTIQGKENTTNLFNMSNF